MRFHHLWWHGGKHVLSFSCTTCHHVYTRHIKVKVRRLVILTIAKAAFLYVIPSNMASQHVIIIGAGLGGLTLGQGLKKAGISFSIFERDESPAFRPQGYRLRINGDGSSSLRKTLSSDVWELLEKTTARTNLGFTSLDPLSGNVTSHKPGPGPPRPGMPTEDPSGVYTCDRATLRAALMVGLDSDLHFGKTFSSYTSLPAGEIEVLFTDGSTVQGSLLVGADGIGSRVRQQFLPNHKMVDTQGAWSTARPPSQPSSWTVSLIKDWISLRPL